MQAGGLRTSVAPISQLTPQPTLLESRREVLDQVLGVLDPDREADQPVADAELPALVRRKAGVRGGRGPRDERFDAAEARRLDRELQALEEPVGRGRAARDRRS